MSERLAKANDRIKWHEEQGRVKYISTDWNHEGTEQRLRARGPEGKFGYREEYEDTEPIAQPFCDESYCEAVSALYERLNIWLLQKMNPHRREEDC